MDSVHTSIYDVMKHAAVKAFFTGDADEFLDERMYKLAESLNFEQDFARHVIRSPTFSVPMTRLSGNRLKELSPVKQSLDKRTFGK